MAIREPGGITPKGDKKNERVEGISNVAKTVNTMQQNVESEIKKTEKAITNRKDIQEIQSSMNGVLRKLNNTMSAFQKGMVNVTSSTAKATKDAIGQYGQAISQEIKIDKRNLVASALAQSTPIFGYFAAKFMETDVFKKAASRMKDQVAKAFGGVANIFRRGKEAKEEKIPHMQHGGYVERGGLAELHPAEVVMPIDEVLERIDESLSLTRQISVASRKAQLRALGNMATFVQMSQKKQEVGLAKGFVRAYSEVNSQYLEPDSKRQLRALLAIQDAIGAQISSWQQIWQKMLIEHPFFRNLMFFTRGIWRLTTSPFRFAYSLWKARGGYTKILSRQGIPFVAMNETLGAFAVENLWRLDNIAVYTRATAEAVRDMSSFLTGKRYRKLPGLEGGLWRIISILAWPLTKLYSGIFRKFVVRPIENAVREAILGKWGKRGEGLADFLTTEEGLYQLPGMWRRRTEFAVGRGLEEADFSMVAKTEKLQRRIQPYMEPFYRYGAAYFDYHVDLDKVKEKRDRSLMKIEERQLETIEDSYKLQKRRGILRWMTMIIPFITSLFSNVVSMITSPIKGLTNLFKGSGILRAFSSGPALAKFLGPAAGVLGAAAIGYGIGTAIDKYLLKPIRNKLFEERIEAKKKADVSTGKAWEAQQEALARIRAGKGTAEDRMLVGRVGGMRGQLLEMEKTRAKYIKGNVFEQLFGDKDVLQAVTGAQVGYMVDNINEYMKYPQGEIERVRADFLKKGKGLGINYRKDPYTAGLKREQMFLKYLMKHGTPRYQEMYDPTMMERAGIEVRDVGAKIGRGYETAKTAVTETAMATVDRTKMVATEVQNEFSKVSAHSREIAKNMNAGIDRMVDVGKEGVGAVVNVTNTAVSNMSNSVATSVNQGKNLLGDARDDLTSHILNGRVQ